MFQGIFNFRTEMKWKGLLVIAPSRKEHDHMYLNYVD